MNNTSDAGEWYQNFSHICYAAPEADSAKSVCGPKDVCSQKGRNSSRMMTTFNNIYLLAYSFLSMNHSVTFTEVF